MEANELIEKVSTYLPDDKVAVVRTAYEFAARAHHGQVRKTGEPYLEHPLSIAMDLADFHLDADTIVAALLHDVPEDCGVSLNEVEATFGSQVAKLVDGVTKLNKLTSRTQAEET
ncbi:MAG TPA: bifunctional (p)ppGpp synthetase/guanosine-3',5'-bis(diphosphate) 3'-pyrophosphohydrolase, partial [Chloroflexi bacterium]|nr:bifunctional (p)ppGpp synthetase/guanosine-3',5'-bis(diphosphate) 3'-pyrophosphohydrolase [Chloroflexota bacterium]